MTNSLKRTDLDEIYTTESHILESITDGFFALDRNWNFTYVNRVFEKVLQMNRQDLIGENYWDHFPETRDLEFYDQYQRAMTQKESIHFEAFYPKMNIWFIVNAYPTENGMAVYFQDISEKKQAQHALFAEGQNLKAIINNTDDLIWSVDSDLNIICANNAYLQRAAELRFESAEKTKDADSPLFHSKAWMNHYAKALAGKSFKKILKTSAHDEVKYEEISLNPIYGKGGKITGVSCISRDITEEQKFQQELKERNQRLKEIAWIQSHQIRNHVANLLGLTEVLSCDICDQNMIAMIKASVEQIDVVLREVCIQAEK